MTNNPNSTNTVPTLDDVAVRDLVHAQQDAFQKARGSHALALMVASAYVAIRNIVRNATPETQAAILDEHAVSPAADGTSIFTPWIKVYWGEPHYDKSVTFKDGQGVTRTMWVPDRSMEIYHHTMEELMARGVETTDVKAIANTIMASNGASQMAKARKARLANTTREAAAPVTENTRQLFLSETQGQTVQVDLDRPEGHGEYMTLLVRAVKDSPDYEVLGIADPNAIKALDKIANKQAESLRTRVEARNSEAKRLALEQQIRDEERNRIIGGLDGPTRKALLYKLKNAQSSKQSAPQHNNEKLA